MAQVPALMEGFARLIETPSVSSVDPRLDMSNRPVADLLAGWFAGLGFDIDIGRASCRERVLRLV